MHRRLFTAGLAAGAVSSLAAPSVAFPVPNGYLDDLEEDNAIELLQIPNLRRLRTLFRDAPRVLREVDLAGTRRNGLSLILTPRLNTQDGTIRLDVRGEIKNIARPLLTSDGTAPGHRVSETPIWSSRAMSMPQAIPAFWCGKFKHRSRSTMAKPS